MSDTSLTGLDPVKVAWVKGELKIDVPDSSPVLQTVDPGGDYAKKLQEVTATVQTVKTTPVASEKGRVAGAAVASAFSEAEELASKTQYKAAIEKLDTIEAQAKIVADESAAAKLRFDNALRPVREGRLKIVRSLGGLATVDSKVTQALATAEEAETKAQDEADKRDYAAATQLLHALRLAMTGLDQEMKAAGDVLDGMVTKKLARLKRREEALKGTKLTTSAQAALAVHTSAGNMQSLANGMPLQSDRLCALAPLPGKLDTAATEALEALQQKQQRGTVTGLEKIRAGAGTAVADIVAGFTILPSTKKRHADLKQRLDAWDVNKGNLDSVTDPADWKRQAKVLDTEIRSILDAATVSWSDSTTQAKRQAVYKDALKERFGLSFEIPPDMTNTQFDVFYDMLDSIPPHHNSQDSLKILAYDKASSGASYNTGLKRVKMGNFTREETWDYQDPANPATKLPMNAFSINSLHEIGHAVDDKYGIMKKHGGTPGCAAWKEETQDDVVQALLGELKAGSTPITASDTDIEGLIVQGFAGTLGKRPVGIGDPEWNAIKAQVGRAFKMKADKWPWGAGSNSAIGTRTYHEAYANRWVSYDASQRAGKEVRDYQFRAPGEWFAELYAYTWFKKVAPPGGLSKDVAKFFWTAKA